jgi:hypothetical protein
MHVPFSGNPGSEKVGAIIPVPIESPFDTPAKTYRAYSRIDINALVPLPNRRMLADPLPRLPQTRRNYT